MITNHTVTVERLEWGAIKRTHAWTQDGQAMERSHLVRPSGPGICRRCGCSDDDACPGGCSWANRDHTICTSCVAVAAPWLAS